jgi:hypothetical protein
MTHGKVKELRQALKLIYESNPLHLCWGIWAFDSGLSPADMLRNLTTVFEAASKVELEAAEAILAIDGDQDDA